MNSALEAQPTHPSHASAEEVEPTVIAVAAHSHSNLLATSRGIVGVLHATNEALPEVGSKQVVRIVFPGEESVMVDTVVAFHREPRSGERWPAAGLKFTLADERRDSLVARFARFREPTYVPDELLTQR